MRVVRLASNLPPVPGGLEIHVRELSLAQARQGHSVELFFGEGEAPEAENLVARRVAHRPLRRLLPAQIAFAMEASGAGRRLSKRPGVIHAHGDYAIALAASSLSRAYGCPCVLTVHGGLSERPIHQFLGRAAFSRLSHIIAVSEEIRKQLLMRGAVSERVSVISSGIHASRFRPADPEARHHIRRQLGLDPACELIVSVGRLHPVKGFEHLIRAASILAGERPRVKVLIAGEGPERGRLQDAAASTSNVRLLGALSEAEVASLLEAADLFVLPSLDLGTQREGTPTSILEAMAVGLPVVASATGGIPALIRSGVNGTLFPAGDAPRLAAAICDILTNPPLAAQMAETNRALALSRDWSCIAAQISAVYEQAAARRH